jgi:hypothetical protein
MKPVRLPRNAALFALACGLGLVLAAAPAMAANNCTARISASNQTVTEGTPNVVLDGTASSPKNSDWTYQWSQLSGPAVTLSSTTAAQPSFTAPSVNAAGASLVFQLKLLNCSNTNGNNITTTTISVLNSNDPPFAVATVSPTPAHEGNVVSLNGSGSSDPEGAPLTYAWTQVLGAPVTLSNANTAIATFIAPNTAYPSGASFSFRLTVSDGTLTAQTDKIVSVVWDNDAPVARLACPAAVNEGATVVLNGSTSSDLEDNAAGTPLSYAWFQLDGPPNLPVSVLTPTASITFTAPQLGYQNTGFLPFRLVVTDSGGLQSSRECTVQVRDVTAPVISGATAFSVEATSATGASVSYSPTVFDNVDGNSLATCNPLSPVQFALGPHKVDCSAHDSAVPQNTATASFIVTVVDTTAPLIAVHLPVAAEADGATGSVVSYSAPATSDAVDGAGSASCLPASGSLFPLGDTAVACNAVDAHLNHAVPTSFVVTVADSLAPTIVAPPAQTFEASAAMTPLSAADYGSPTITDAVGVVDQHDDAPPLFPLGLTTIHWYAKDAANNSATASTDITVLDRGAPSLQLPADFDVEATGPAGAPVTFSVTASDPVDANVDVTCTPASGALLGLGAHGVDCVATDDSGNHSQGSFIATVKDGTPPSLTVPGDFTVEATGPTGALVSFSASASDLVDTSVDIVCTPASGTVLGLGPHPVACVATDDSGNQSTGNFIVTVADTTAPVLDLPADFAVEATGPAGAQVSFAASASDIVDSNVEVVCTPASGSVLGLGAHGIDCVATDDSGNHSEASFTATVQDTTAPSLSLPADFAVEATGPGGALVDFAVSASDIVDTDVGVVCTPASGNLLALGPHTIACVATDDSGNHGDGSFVVTVADTTAPVIAAASHIGPIEATAAAGALINYTSPATSDLVDGPGVATCLQASGGFFAIGTTTVNCNATDGHGNQATPVSFTVEVVDTTAPVIAAHGPVGPVEATSSAGASVSYTSPATSDAVDGPGVALCTPASGSTFGIGSQLVLCSAVDAHLNLAAPVSFAVQVVDSTAPVIASHDNIGPVEATGSYGAAVSYASPATSDAVDGAGVAQCLPASGSNFAIGTSTVSCSATDGHGNGSSSSFTITVRDSTGPAITAHADVTAIATANSGATVTYTLPTASDLVDGARPVSCLAASGTVFAVGSNLVTCTASDSRGNSSSSSFHVIVSFGWGGFFSPVDNLPTVNSVKAGSAIPVKFSLGGNQGLDIFAAGYPRSVVVSCATGAPQDLIEETVTAGGSSLSYGNGQYVYVWKTDKSWVGNCRQLQVKLTDGSLHVANFIFK